MVNKIRRWLMRFTNPLLFLVMVLVPISSLSADEEKQAPSNSSATHHHINIPSTNLAAALNALAKQTQALFMFPYDIAETRPAKSVTGRYTILEALDIILKDSGLASDLSEKGVIKIYLDDASANNQGKRNMNTKKNLLASTIAFFMGSAVQGVVAQEDMGGQDEGEWALDEIIVTATKRSSNLQDTAMSISSISNETIKKRGLVSMKDYLATVAGVSYIEAGPGENRVIIRGLSLGPADQQSTSGTYLGEMPTSSASRSSFDIKMVDIERVEVLRGPQGTLYGSNALGGTVRNIPIAPDLENFIGKINFDASFQDESDDLNQSAEGIINLPLVNDQLGLRVAVYHHDNAGYVDAISTPIAETVASDSGSTVLVEDDIGSSTFSGGRASLLWQPTSKANITLMLGTQEVDEDGTSLASETVGDAYDTSYLNNGRSETSSTDYSNIVAEYNSDWFTIVSSTSYIENEVNLDRNFFAISQNLLLGPARALNKYATELISQEVRLTSNLHGDWQYLMGFFYEDVERVSNENATWEGTNTSANLFGQQILGSLQLGMDYEQKSFFGEISYQFNEQFQLTIGGRHFDYDRIDTTVFLIDAIFGTSADNSEEDLSETGQTFKANLSFTPDDNTLIYAQWSEGFRIGKGQSIPPRDLCDVDGNGKLDFTEGVLTNRVEADTTDNIELGIKLALLDRRLLINTSIFNIDWENVPVAIGDTSDTCPGLSRITNNIGEARSRGMELETSYYISSSLKMDFSASYMDTEWLEARAPIVKGESLIYAPRTNASLGLQYDFSLTSFPAYLRADIGYVGEYETIFRAVNFPTGGDYVNVNLRAGINMRHWSFTFYVTNLTGEDELLFYDTGINARNSPGRLGFAVGYEF